MNNLVEYFEEQLTKAFQNEFELYIQADVIYTKIDCYDDLLKYLDFKKCRETIFPDMDRDCISYEYCGDDLCGNEVADEMIIKIDIESLTKDKVDIFCKIMADGYTKYLKEYE
jgi:hypothetical protein